MEKDKKLSAARKKLQEYKLNKGGSAIPPGVGTIVTSVNEIRCSDSPNDGQTNGQPSGIISLHLPPPPKSINFTAAPVPVNEEIKIKNLQEQAVSESIQSMSDTDSFMTMVAAPTISTAPNSATASLFNPSSDQIVSPNSEIGDNNSAFGQDSMQLGNLMSSFVPTPSAPPLLNSVGNRSIQYGIHTDAGQDFPVNFFQAVPVAQQFQPVSFNSFQQQNSQPQEFIFNQPQVPLFYNVEGNNIKPVEIQTYQSEEMEQGFASNSSPSSPNPVPVVENEYLNSSPQVLQSGDNNLPSDFEPSVSSNQQENEMRPTVGIMNFLDSHPGQSEQNTVLQQSRDMSQFDMQKPVFREMPTLRTPTPTMRRLSMSSQDEKDKLEIQTLQRLQSVQDALELQIDEFRLANARLLGRQSELVSQLEGCEKNIQELRRERDRAKEDAKKLAQPLHAKINNLYEENQKILKNSSDVGMELRMKLQEKTKLYEEMEKACINMSNSKMDLAAKLDHEKEHSKELESALSKKNEEIEILRRSTSKLEERFKSEQQKDAIIHQLEDQRRHFQVQTESLQEELSITKTRLKQINNIGSLPSTNMEKIAHSAHDHHHGDTPCEHDHSTAEKSSHDHGHSHSHGHDGHDHSHGHDGHDHSHGHDGHDHSHGHDGHDHGHPNGYSQDQLAGQPRPPTSPEEEMKKRLHHLEWENSTFRSDVEKLATDAKDKKKYEEKCIKLQEECDKLRKECQRLELLVVQLQGENDTIGDYIALYQTQRLALKESSKAKDAQLDNIAKEREVLLAKMAELTQLLRDLKKRSANAENSSSDQLDQICSGHHSHDPNSSPQIQPHKEIEGKIMNLLTEISSSSLIENFHPCAVCSGRLMNV